MKLTIGKPVKYACLKNSYQIKLDLCHGDADLTTYEVRNFGKNDPNLIPCLEMLSAYQFTDFNARERPECFLEDLYPNDEEKAGKMLEHLYDLVGRDEIWDGCMAGVDDVKVTYFDENGVEYEVTIEEK